MRLLIILLSFVVFPALYSQELNCNLIINSDQIQGSNRAVFNTLQRSAQEFINNRRWTDLTFNQNERIECNINIIVRRVEGDLFYAEIQVQSRRPVFNSSYNTTLFNFRDNDFVFTYKEFDVLDFNESTISSNLTAVLAYYVYMIIGYDMDSYSRMGGTPFFQAAERIVVAAQSLDLPGWRAFESTRNRYALVNNLTDEAFRRFRGFFYEYHRLGLDEMTINMTNARARIAAGLPILRETNRARPAAIAIASFLDTKTDELISIFQGATDQEKRKAVEVLSDVNPSQEQRYQQIMRR